VASLRLSHCAKPDDVIGFRWQRSACDLRAAHEGLALVFTGATLFGFQVWLIYFCKVSS
jgi:hypothetical protein